MDKRLIPLDLQFFADKEGDETPPAGVKTTETDQQQQPQKPESKMIPYERFKEVNDNLRTFKETFKELGIESVDALKEIISDYQKRKEADEERKRKEMTELERLQDVLKKKQTAEQELQKQIEALKKQVESEKIRNAFITKAQEANIAYIDDALKLADLSNVTVDDEGVKGIDEVIKNLVETKPFLLKQQSNQPKQIGEPSNYGGKDSQKTAEQLLAEAAEKAKKSGKIEDLAAYQKLKRVLDL